MNGIYSCSWKYSWSILVELIDIAGDMIGVYEWNIQLQVEYNWSILVELIDVAGDMIGVYEWNIQLQLEI